MTSFQQLIQMQKNREEKNREEKITPNQPSVVKLDVALILRILEFLIHHAQQKNKNKITAIFQSFKRTSQIDILKSLSKDEQLNVLNLRKQFYFFKEAFSTIMKDQSLELHALKHLKKVNINQVLLNPVIVNQNKEQKSKEQKSPLKLFFLRTIMLQKQKYGFTSQFIKKLNETKMKIASSALIQERSRIQQRTKKQIRSLEINNLEDTNKFESESSQFRNSEGKFYDLQPKIGDYQSFSKIKVDKMVKYLEKRGKHLFGSAPTNYQKLNQIAIFLLKQLQKFMKHSLKEVIKIAQFGSKFNSHSDGSSTTQFTYFSQKNFKLKIFRPFLIAKDSKISLVPYKPVIDIYANLRRKQLEKESQLLQKFEQKFTNNQWSRFSAGGTSPNQKKERRSQHKMDVNVKKYLFSKHHSSTLESYRTYKICEETRNTAALNISIKHMIYFIEQHRYLCQTPLLFYAYTT